MMMEIMAPSGTNEEDSPIKVNEADFNKFAASIQEQYAVNHDVETTQDSECSIADVNNLNRDMCSPEYYTTSCPSALLNKISLEVQLMSSLQQHLPELSAFTLHKKIGSGTFSVVYLASLKANPRRLFALKHLVPTTLPHRIMHELKCLQEMGGQDNVVGVHLCLRKDNCIVFVMPYLPNVKITDFIKDVGVAETREYMRGLFVALCRVHSFNIIHRDVKPNNFLYDRRRQRYLLIDFGLSCNSYVPSENLSRVSSHCKLPAKKKRMREENSQIVTDTTDMNPLKRLALQSIQFGNIVNSPQKTIANSGMGENCPPATDIKPDRRVNEVKKRLFSNDSLALAVCMEESNVTVECKKNLLNNKSPLLSTHSLSKFNSDNPMAEENLRTPEENILVARKLVSVPEKNKDSRPNQIKHMEFVAPKKNGELLWKSALRKENKVAVATKARKQLMPYSKEEEQRSDENGLSSKKYQTEQLMPCKNVKTILSCQRSVETKPYGRNTFLNFIKKNEYLQTPAEKNQLVNDLHCAKTFPCDEESFEENTNTVMNTPKNNPGLKTANSVRQYNQINRCSGPLMAPKEVLSSQRIENKCKVAPQISKLNGMQKFQTLMSSEKNVMGTSLRVQDSQVKELRKETFISPTNVSSLYCSCYARGRVCDVCMKRKPMVASRAGTPGFRPPEVLLKYAKQTTAVDMWAAGVIMLSLISGCYPFFRSPSDVAALTELTTLFGSKRFQEVAKKLGRNVTVSQVKKPLNLRKLCEALRRRGNNPKSSDGLPTCFDCRQVIDKMEGCMCETETNTCLNFLPQDKQSDSIFPPSAYDLLNKLLDLDPETRITAAEALEHPFLKGE